MRGDGRRNDWMTIALYLLKLQRIANCGATVL